MCADKVLFFASRQTFRFPSGFPVQSFQFFCLLVNGEIINQTQKAKQQQQYCAADNSYAQISIIMMACQAMA